MFRGLRLQGFAAFVYRVFRGLRLQGVSRPSFTECSRPSFTRCFAAFVYRVFAAFVPLYPQRIFYFINDSLQATMWMMWVATVNFGPDRFSRFNVYCIETNLGTNAQTRQVCIYKDIRKINKKNCFWSTCLNADFKVNNS